MDIGKAYTTLLAKWLVLIRNGKKENPWRKLACISSGSKYKKSDNKFKLFDFNRLVKGPPVERSALARPSLGENISCNCVLLSHK